MMVQKLAVTVVEEDFKKGQCTNDIKYNTHLYWWFLKLIGVWPTEETVNLKLHKNLPKIQVVLYCCLLGVSFIPCILHTCLEEDDIGVQLKAMGPLSWFLVTLCKYRSMLSKNQSIQKCFDHIKEDWRNVKFSEDREIMLKNAEFGRNFTLTSAIFISSGTFFYYGIMPLVVGTIATEYNVTIRPLSHPTYDKLWNAQESPLYETIFLIELLASLLLSVITINTCGLTALLISHACGQLQIVMAWLEDFVNGDRSDGISEAERMAMLVRYHLRVLNFIKFVERLLRDMCEMEFVVCTLNMCLLGYYFVTELQSSAAINIVAYATLFVSFTYNIFIFCYMGDRLTEQCVKVGLTTYMIDWYCLPRKNALGLILISKMSNSPQKLRAGKILELSLTTFCSVFKTSMVYLNVLRTMVN